MSGKRRSSARRPKVGIVRRDGSQKQRNLGSDDTWGYPPPRGAVFAQRIRRGGSFQLPANTGWRQGRKGRGHGTSQARKSRSIIIPPRHYGRSGAESARRNLWPGPSNYQHRSPLKQKKRGFVHPPCLKVPYGGCCEVGEPAGVLFDAAARDDQHGYFDRSQREVGHGICRAAPGAPPPLKTPNSGRWDRPGFVVASPCKKKGGVRASDPALHAFAFPRVAR
jgi:hypothetical protein